MTCYDLYNVEKDVTLQIIINMDHHNVFNFSWSYIDNIANILVCFFHQFQGSKKPTTIPGLDPTSEE